MQSYGFCKGCGKQILWTTTMNGKAMPCNPEVIRFNRSQFGKETFVTAGGYVIKGDRNESGEENGYISHFATCPKSGTFRKAAHA